MFFVSLVVLFDPILSVLVLFSLLFLFCFVKALNLEEIIFDIVSTCSVVLVLVSHFVICCCVDENGCWCFPVVSCDDVLFVDVVDVMSLMFGAGGFCHTPP
jgi:isoprenylcysteine carboxyl methyltransferase (ICMT) family protein YpbQ